MMKKRTLTTAAVAVALTMTLSGLPLTASAALGGLPEVSTIRQAKADSDYDSERQFFLRTGSGSPQRD